MSADMESSAQSESSEAPLSNGLTPSSPAPTSASTSSLDAAAPERFRRKALLLFSVALAIRLLALWAAGDAELVKDEIAYVARAEALLDGKGFQGSYQSWVRHDGWRIMDLPQYTGAYQPPGYPTFSAAVMAISGRSVVAVKLAQCLLSALSCLLLLRIGRAWFGERPALIASWMWALYPNAIAFSHLLWSETLFVFLLLALVELLLVVPVTVAQSRLPSLGRCVAGGVVLALAALTRGTTVFLAPFLVFWMLLLAEGTVGLPRWSTVLTRAGLGRAFLVLGVALACVAPWSVRNYNVHGGFVLIDTNAPYNLWRGNAPSAMALRAIPQAARYSWPFDSVLVNPVGNLNGRELIDAYRRDHRATVEGPEWTPTDLEVMSYATAAARKEILGDPARALRHGVYKLIDMWNPTSFLTRHLEMGAYGDVPSGLRAVLMVIAPASYLGVLFFAVFGLGGALRDRRVWLVVLVVVYFSAGSALAFGLTRFRFPLMPLIMLIAALELARRRPRARAPELR